MQKLWKGFEHYLFTKFPQASTLATPFNDPIAESIEEYQAFLKSLGYSPFVQGAFGKKISATSSERIDPLVDGRFCPYMPFYPPGVLSCERQG